MSKCTLLPLRKGETGRGESALWNSGQSCVKDRTKNAAIIQTAKFKQLRFCKFTVLQTGLLFFTGHEVWENRSDHKTFLNFCPSSNAGWFVSWGKYGQNAVQCSLQRPCKEFGFGKPHSMLFIFPLQRSPAPLHPAIMAGLLSRDPQHRR